MKEEVIANPGQLKKAFKQKANAIEEANNLSNSHELLRFYANECGLKAQYLDRNRLKDTSEFENSPLGKKYGHGHDLIRWIDDLKIPESAVKRPKKSRPFLFSQLHETLRYGVTPVEEHIEINKSIHTYLKKSL